MELLGLSMIEKQSEKELQRKRKTEREGRKREIKRDSGRYREKDGARRR